MLSARRPIATVATVLLVVLAGCSLPVVDDGRAGTGTQAKGATSTTPAAAGTGTGGATTDRTAQGSERPTASPTASPTPEPTPTVESPTGIRVVEVNADVESVGEEYIVLKNTGDIPLDLSGWRVKDDDGNVYTFSDGVDLGTGETLTLHTARGTQTESDRYWWSDEQIWDDGGERLAIFDERGQQVYVRTYS